MKYFRCGTVSGFTLIELLVVISIIGFLSSVVLASLANARNKAANSAVKSNLANIRAQAELIYGSADSPKGYDGVCFYQKIQDMYKAAAFAGSGNANDGLCNATLSGSSWAVTAPLKSPENGNGFWCVDYTGASMGRASKLSAGVYSCQ